MWLKWIGMRNAILWMLIESLSRTVGYWCVCAPLYCVIHTTQPFKIIHIKSFTFLYCENIICCLFWIFHNRLGRSIVLRRFCYPAFKLWSFFFYYLIRLFFHCISFVSIYAISRCRSVFLSSSLFFFFVCCCKLRKIFPLRAWCFIHDKAAILLLLIGKPSCFYI